MPSTDNPGAPPADRAATLLPGGWRKMRSAPKDGRRVHLFIPYDRGLFSAEECQTKGYWDATSCIYHLRKPGCWRFDGDDGAFDIQPIGWRPLPAAEEASDGE